MRLASSLLLDSRRTPFALPRYTRSCLRIPLVPASAQAEVSQSCCTCKKYPPPPSSSHTLKDSRAWRFEVRCVGEPTTRSGFLSSTIQSTFRRSAGRLQPQELPSSGPALPMLNTRPP
eukprot:480902-Pyramimonas_sp.AAC.1